MGDNRCIVIYIGYNVNIGLSSREDCPGYSIPHVNFIKVKYKGAVGPMTQSHCVSQGISMCPFHACYHERLPCVRVRYRPFNKTATFRPTH